MSEFLFNKVAGLRPVTLLKRDSNTGIFCEYFEILKNRFFEKYLRTVASEKRSLHSYIILSGSTKCTLTKQIEKLTTLKVFKFLFARFLRMKRDNCTQHNSTVSRRRIVWNTVEYILQLIMQMA